MKTLISCIKAFFKSNSVRIPVIFFVLIALITFSLGGLLVYKIAVDPIKLFQTPIPTNMPSPTPEPQSKVTVPNLTHDAQKTIEPIQSQDIENESALSQNTGIINILLIGADYSPERADLGKNYYSDVMLVIAIDFDNNSINLISVPRDTFAPIYNTPGIYKLNTALHHGGGVEGNGFKYVVESVENVLGGIDIDYYIGVNMTAVKILVDEIGGIDYHVDVTFDMQGRHMSEGYQHLDGQEVLDYCRIRKGVDNDIGRVDRQKKILIAVFNKLKKSSLLFEVPNIIRKLKDDIYTNLSFEQFCALAVFGKGVDSDDIQMHTVEGHFLQIFNWSIYILDDEERMMLIDEVYGFTPQPMPEASQKYAKLTWAQIQAEGYIRIINNVINSDKISDTSRIWLKKDMNVLQEAIDEGDRHIIEQKSEALKTRATSVFASAGIKVRWFVNENPGKERMTG